MTSVAEKDLSEYTGKKIIVTVNLTEPNEKGELAIEVEGKAESANALGILFKPKGKAGLELIEIGQIEDVRLAPESDKKLTRRVLKVVELGGAKPHLLDRHGLTLGEINGLDEEQAFTYHEGLDHEGLDLGHLHSNEKSSADARAAELEAKVDGTEPDANE